MCNQAIAYPSAAMVPVNFDLIAAIEKAAHSAAEVAALRREVAEARTRAVPKCAECDQPATHYCGKCAEDFCAVHSQQLHAMKLFQSHTVVAVTEKAAQITAVKAAVEKRGTVLQQQLQQQELVSGSATPWNVAAVWGSTSAVHRSFGSLYAPRLCRSHLCATDCHVAHRCAPNRI